MFRFKLKNLLRFEGSFYKNILASKLENINEAEGIYMEHILFASVIDAMQKGYRFISLWQPIKQQGISGSTGTELVGSYSFKSYVAYLRKFFMSFLSNWTKKLY